MDPKSAFNGNFSMGNIRPGLGLFEKSVRDGKLFVAVDFAPYRICRVPFYELDWFERSSLSSV